MTPDGKVDYSKDFFGKPAFMTVSGQLAVEPFCCSLSNVYTFGPCFRAENSHTSRHLAEFWMIEPELAFADLFDEQVEPGLLKRLESLLAEPFARVSYTEGIEI